MATPRRRRVHGADGRPSRTASDRTRSPSSHPTRSHPATFNHCKIVYEDDWMVAVEKPAGLATAHAPAGHPSVFSWLQRMWLPRKASSPASLDGAGRPFVGVVSRLDQPVSGVVVFAKTRASAASLSEQFKARSVEKTYIALVEGRFPGRVGEWMTWSDQMAELPRSTRARAADVLEQDGDPREASTTLRLLQRSGEVSLVELRPATGRKHQLRRQLAQRRCPIVGDRRYGARIPLVDDAIALHAKRLVLRHPADGRAIDLRARPPSTWLNRFPSIRIPSGVE